jgi:hypothetical protein
MCQIILAIPVLALVSFFFLALQGGPEHLSSGCYSQRVFLF